MDDKIILEISEKYGTPLYIYDSSIIERQIGILKSVLPAEFGIFYSMKANPLLWLCRFFSTAGLGIEAASEGELYTALKAGVPPDKLIFTSPGKNAEELTFAIENGIYSINVESLAEAESINRIACSQNKIVQVAIRINPDFDYSQAGIKMTGVASQFGIDQEQAGDAIRAIKTFSNLKLIGMHVYTGTQILIAAEITATMDAIFNLAAGLCRDYDLPLQFLDLGGGFGIPYFKEDAVLDTALLQQGLAAIWNRHRVQFAQTRICVESGRFLMAEAGIYAAQILYAKKSKGKNFLVCDGGSLHNAASAFLGRRVRNNFPLKVLSRATTQEKTTVTGPLNASTDVIGQDLLLPCAAPGDIVVIEKAGAYGLSFSPVHSGSHPLPAEVVVHNSAFCLVRHRGTVEDAMQGQNPVGEM